MMNKIILMGRLTRDPEVRYSQGANATAICRYSLAVDRKFKRDGEPDADFFSCTVFGKGAELAEKYFRQGTKILISGRVQNDNYTNRDGQKVYSVQIIVEEQEFAESKSATERARAGVSADRYTPTDAGDGFMHIPEGIDEELPFM